MYQPDEEGLDFLTEASEEPEVLQSPLWIATRAFEQAQEARIRANNQIAAWQRSGTATDAELQWFTTLYERWMSVEKTFLGDVKILLKGNAVWEYLTEIKGIGPSFGGRLLSRIDFAKARHVSGLWKYCGMSVEDGKADRFKADMKGGYSPALKATCYLISGSFLKARSPYREVYGDSKTYYQAARPDWTPMHIHRAASRKMVKVFLQHLWVTGRKVHGLPVTMPYVHERLGHEMVYTPEAFGWRPVL